LFPEQRAIRLDLKLPRYEEVFTYFLLQKSGNWLEF